MLNSWFTTLTHALFLKDHGWFNELEGNLELNFFLVFALNLGAWNMQFFNVIKFYIHHIGWEWLGMLVDNTNTFFSWLLKL